jgi:hypothetical protein
MPRKVVIPGLNPVPHHWIDDEGKNHYAIRNQQRFRYDYFVKAVQAEIKSNKGEQDSEFIFFNVILYEEYDLGLGVPLRVIGPLWRHMNEIAGNFELKRSLLVPKST